MTTERTEDEIFSELSSLCKSPGFAHVIAFFSFRDNIIKYSGKATVEDMTAVPRSIQLLRIEISTLHGLLLGTGDGFKIPSFQEMQEYVLKAQALLEDLHDALTKPLLPKVNDDSVSYTENPFGPGKATREPIFYGGESAHSFQYLELAKLKYAVDAEWLRENVGFSIDDASKVVQAIDAYQSECIRNGLQSMSERPVDEQTYLPAFELDVDQIAENSGLAKSVTTKVLDKFSVSVDAENDGYKSPHDFNLVNERPILKDNEGRLFLFQYVSLTEALYEAPFFWINNDEEYLSLASKHRGQFTEDQCYLALSAVFGEFRVFRNVDIYSSKDRIGEIDILAVFGDAAIVVQAKSKRLTIGARRGDDGKIKNDFQLAIQDSNNQAHACARALLNSKNRLVDGNGHQLNFDTPLETVYPMCVLSDFYPALNFQVRQFLKFETSDVIRAPFVLDVFSLDVITEFLTAPLHFLYYIDRRAEYFDRLLVSSENALFGYYCTNNLFIPNDITMLHFEDDCSVKIDLAMNARRYGLPGERTPEGMLTRYESTPLGKVLEQLNALATGEARRLGLLLYSLNFGNTRKLNSHITRIRDQARHDGGSHDASLPIDDSGVTFHCNRRSTPDALEHLREHCEVRKHDLKRESWFGVRIRPENFLPSPVIEVRGEWKYDARLARKTIIWSGIRRAAANAGPNRKIGRNDLCFCGSGEKYKKCCLPKYEN